MDSVAFCFKYLDLSHKTFSLDDLPKKFGNILLARFKGFGQMPFAELAPATGNKTLHSHTAEADRICAHGGFRDVPTDLWQSRPWQLMIQNKMRAIGFITERVFHIVWIDKDHKFDPGKGR